MRKLILGNWKMHGTREHLSNFFRDLERERLKASYALVQLGLALPAPLLPVATAHQIEEFWLGGQTCHHLAEGAYTGDVNAAMMKEAGASFVLVGHSERRRDHKEDATIIAGQMAQALSEGLRVVFCVGEDSSQNLEDVLQDQVRAVLVKNRTALNEMSKDSQIIMAYEPVWAIGSGQTPTPDEIARATFIIKRTINECDARLGHSCPVIYGGSVGRSNAGVLRDVRGLEGLLVGKASLDAAEFTAVARAFSDAP